MRTTSPALAGSCKTGWRFGGCTLATWLHPNSSPGVARAGQALRQSPLPRGQVTYLPHALMIYATSAGLAACPASTLRRNHSRCRSTPKRLACPWQIAGNLGHRRSPLLVQTSESGLSGEVDVSDSNGTGAWCGGNAESRPQRFAAVQVHYAVR